MNWLLLEAQYTIEYYQTKCIYYKRKNRYNIIKRQDINRKYKFS